MDRYIEDYKRVRKKAAILFLVLMLLLLSVILFSLGMGSMNISYNEALKIILSKITGNQALLSGIKNNAAAVVWDIRLPRIITSAMVGAGLSISGSVFQSVLRNPLADPYTLGISTGAAFGASVAIYLNVALGLFIPVSFIALVSSFITLMCVMAISKRGGGIISSNLIIAGIIVSSFLSAGISFVKMMAGENVSAIVFWLMGSIASKTWNDVAVLFFTVTVCSVICCVFSKNLNLMTLGEKNAASLGVDVRFIRILYLVTASVITAVCVSSCGIIGFVGLIVPHMLRFLVSGDNRILLPLSSVLGALLLCVADNVTRLISKGEIPVGVLTTLLGGPFFIWLFIRKGGNKFE